MPKKTGRGMRDSGLWAVGCEGVEVRTIEIVGAKLSHEFPAEPIDGMGSAERKRTINESFRGSDRSFNSTPPRLRLRDYSAPSRKVVARIAADPRPT